MRKIIFYFLIAIPFISYSQEDGVRGLKEIPFMLTDEGHIIIEVQVNGEKGNFIFDTGAGLNLLTKKFAEKLKGLDKTHHFYTGHRATGEALEGDLWKSQYIEVGSLKIAGELFVIYDFDFPIDGLISLTPFKNSIITVDYRKRVIKIESEKSIISLLNQKHFEMPLIISDDRDITLGIFTTIKLGDSLNLDVSLDSGAGAEVYKFSSRYMKNLGIDFKDIKPQYKKSFFNPEWGNNHFYSNVNKMSDLDDNVIIDDFPAVFIEGLIYEGIMSINWIGEIVTIDIPGERLIVQK